MHTDVKLAGLYTMPLYLNWTYKTSYIARLPQNSQYWIVINKEFYPGIIYCGEVLINRYNINRKLSIYSRNVEVRILLTNFETILSMSQKRLNT